ncbi:MAG: UDP-3-O-acyl-N-acetylglucosamine deacetylase [Deltaproteobacteria bacterium]|nr:UDP-3-O-acyl-N-acetylglucosamine deacetylase [Deltaproteobacteria bacterium]MBW2019395.1 UDP-3-O-acyl-N-acetylglucosamine deacetylase [Deltaproteobacteria bacterium]MBW2074232.1 UDP-3-O-acyl-N-acetylglucosamine deacetylase [Deltaproteobacteria bacterium]RLB83911.1 MAG: UDP-3-O-[3-hydroxymyristoyl] N-acetylglucosamine deacetylase [Deltaproteobacteria bacterium]
MHSHQQTLARPVQCTGIGLHSGKKVNLTIKPAPVNHGIKFVRTDLPHRPIISAHFRNVIDTSLATTLGTDGVIVSTVEHLMAAFAGLGIDNALVEVDAYEAPIMDGSAGPFTAMLEEAGIRTQSGKRYTFVVKKPIEMADEDKKVGLYPSDTLKITCTIEFDHPLVRHQSYTISLTDGLFQKEISRARTFGFLHEVNYLKQNGFARGGSLENAVVIDRDRILNREGLRYENEFVRHKVLDCIGDLSLLGMPFIGHIVAYKSGHTLNHALLKRFIDQKSCWETVQAPIVFP